MTKKHSTSFFLVKVIFPAAVFLLASFPASGAEPYENQELIPGQEPTSEFVTYVENLYNFGIAITAVLAVFMIAIGAFAYIVTSAGNSSKIIDAKAKIYNAIIGLILALVAALVLYIINPDLVKGTMSGMHDVAQKVTGKTNPN